MEQFYTLETASLVLKFDRRSGSLCSLYSKASDWEILNRPHLALSWRLMLPLEDHSVRGDHGRRNNNAWGHKQPRAPKSACSGSKVEFTWDHIVSEYGGEHDITVKTVCEIVRDQAVFRMHIRNNDRVFVENVYYPYLGDLHRPAGCERFALSYGHYMDMCDFELWPTFETPTATHSVDCPTLSINPEMDNPPMFPFALAADERGNGLYIGAAQRRMEAATWHAEALPGWRNSNDFRLFSEDRAFGMDVFTRFAVAHMPFIAPKTEFDLLPFALEGYRGSWETGAACYTRISGDWDAQTQNKYVRPGWAQKPHAWLQVQLNSPEDELRIPFRELPKIGEECAQYGIGALQVTGWNIGGQDRGNPSHDPDPRLGTREELKDAIAQIRAMGVKVILFAKFTWADQSADEFEAVYAPLAIQDPYRNYYSYKGYQYMAASQLANVNTRRLIPMCFGSEAYREICNREFIKCVELGADGILYDECMHHSPALCCFNTAHGHRYGAPAYGWDNQLSEGFRAILRERGLENKFLLAGEALYDFQFDEYDLSYGRTWGRGHRPVSRLMRPHGQIMTAVQGFDDRSMVNQCLLNRYIISYEPYFFKGRPSDYPQTVRYGMKMDCLRRDLAAYFWDGEWRGRLGGAVAAGDGREFGDYAVFRGADGTSGMVIVNYDEQNAVTVAPVLDGGQPLTRYRLVDDGGLTRFDGSFVLPPMSAAAVI